ncbi:MAG: HAD hydrolase-like protein [Leptospiraceae bacterium]
MPETPVSKEFSGLVFLDLDGTIEDSRLDMAGSANAVRRKLSLPEIDPVSLYPFVMKGMDYLYRQCIPEALEQPDLIPGLGPNADESSVLLSLARLYHQEYSQCIVDNTKCYPGMDIALMELSRQCILGLYTNKPERLSRLLLEKLGILQHFTVIYGGDTLPESKPSALPLNTGMSEISAKYSLSAEKIRSRCFMVGDSGGDIKAAAEAKISSIWAAYGYYSEEPAEKPDYVAGQPSDLPELIFNLLK